MIFYVFYLLFSFPENVEYAVSEHLESLKFQKKKRKKEMQGVSSQTLQGVLIVPPQSDSAVLRIFWCSAKTRYSYIKNIGVHIPFSTLPFSLSWVIIPFFKQVRPYLISSGLTL